ncbi:EAL domain-containing protein [Amphritea sp. 2_MG-2023]|uniref:bifunctional diguanylate cyclase/phosphodiesterase n=1 Tax=Amphritea TaxID=515417 RepID=UPI001C0734F3|nr:MULTISPECIES: EAL domain-containing protein [Amphritea]MBU2964447.1 EAL domain-containing protein [Amphritea atlantica]MDO6417775.1 EAL domain-containing protein [Amphritea sp. 2_MG-2023]
MSIVNQLMAAVLAVLIGLAAGTVYLMSDSSKTMLIHQLESHGQDTATHLGLYLAPFMADHDKAVIETTVNAIFDSGFYQQIRVVDADNDPIYIKSTDAQISDSVPDWFINLIEITPPEMTREITYQWQKAGSIFVQSRAGYAYEQLWLGTEKTFAWFVILSLVSLFFISLLMRYILNPLKGVEDQAIALSQQKYIEQTHIPGTRELKQVVLAMNMMVRRVRTMFNEQTKYIEEIRHAAYQDELSGLSNQRATMSQLNERLDYRNDFGPGSLIHLHIADLQGLNAELGVEKANNFIRACAAQLKALAQQTDDPILGRISGSEFILLSHITDPDQLSRELNKLADTLKDNYRQLNGSSEHYALYIGAIAYTEQESSEKLLANAKLAAERAHQENTNVYCKGVGNPDIQSSWHQHVSDKIISGDIFLQCQPTKPMSETQAPIHCEAYARILNQDDQPCAAGEFISVVKQLNLMTALDKSVLHSVKQQLQRHPDLKIAVNLSNDSVKDMAFCDWLIRATHKQPIAKQLCIEINEISVLNNINQVALFRDQLRQSGVLFGVDNFGINPAGFSYLYTVNPDYIKIDGSLIRELDSSAEDRFFVRSLVTIAHSLDIKVYAEHVERETQLSALLQLAVDGSQGWVHGKPERM